MRILILGAGAWGTALGVHAARTHPVMLWARSSGQAAALRSARCNARYLPGVALPELLDATDQLPQALDWVAADGPGLLVLATSVAGLRPTLSAVRDICAAATTPVPALLWLCKGIERETGRLPHQVCAEVGIAAAAGALSGPSFAQEVAAGLPVALTVACRDDALAERAVAAFHLGAARIYRSDDVLGVEIGGALKNVMAIATGVCDGLALGANARAALITRGLAEIARLGVAMGARPETFMGLTGLGDLVLTCTGDLSRNRSVGLGLAAGGSLQSVLASLGHVAEGVGTVAAARALARAHGVDMPIVAAVDDVIAGRLDARAAVGSLLAREPKRE